jgi:hypothetical protein
MELLRLPPYDDLTLSFTVPEWYTQETTFFITVTRLSDLSATVIEESGQDGDVFSYTIPYEHDDSFRVEFRSEVPQHAHLYDDTIELVRPYVAPSTLGTTASEIAEYTKYEEIARAIIGKTRILILDEPTSSLTSYEVEKLFSALRNLAAQGVSIIFILPILDDGSSQIFISCVHDLSE